MPKLTFSPHADDAASLSVGDLTVGNGTEYVALYGQIDLTRDKAGPKLARELKAVLDAVVHHHVGACAYRPRQGVLEAHERR